MYEKTDWVLRKGHVLRGWGSTMAHAHSRGLYATKTVHERVSTLSTTPSMLSRSGLPALREHANASVTENDVYAQAHTFTLDHKLVSCVCCVEGEAG